MATCSSIFAWKIPGIEEPSELQSMASQWTGHACSTENTLDFIICCCCSAAQSCPILCDPMDWSMAGFPVLHYLPEFAQTHVHWIRDTIQPSHLLLPPSLPAFNLSQRQGFLQESAFPIRWPVSCSFSFSISPSNEYSEFIPFRIDWFDPLAVQGTLKSLLQYNSSKASVLQHSVLYGPTLTFIYPCWKNHSHTDLCQQSDVSAFQYTV